VTSESFVQSQAGVAVSKPPTVWPKSTFHWKLRTYHMLSSQHQMISFSCSVHIDNRKSAA